MSRIIPVLTVHDDWMVNVLLTDGRVYAFYTEMWPEQLDGEMGKTVIQRAENEAIFLAFRNRRPFCVVESPLTITAEFLWHTINNATSSMSDADFSDLIRR